MNEALIARFRSKLASGGAVFGPFMKTTDPAFVEAAGYAGMDFAILDMEHGPATIESMQNNIRAAQLSGVLPVIRCADISEAAIGKALDIGAAAVEIPQVGSAEQAREAVRLAKFYPMGERGMCRFVRAAHYSAQPREDYFGSANQTLVILQVEGCSAVEGIDEILSVEGVDILFIGPYDLSQSLGLPGQVAHPKVVGLMQEIVKKARERGVVVGTFADTPEALHMWRAAGVQYLSYSVDIGIFCDACRDLAKRFKQEAQ